jgi:hypothetical protein
MASVSQSGVAEVSVHSKVPCASDATGTGGRPTFCGLSRFTLVQLDPRIATSPDVRDVPKKNEKVVLFFLLPKRCRPRIERSSAFASGRACITKTYHIITRSPAQLSELAGSDLPWTLGDHQNSHPVIRNAEIRVVLNRKRIRAVDGMDHRNS